LFNNYKCVDSFEKKLLELLIQNDGRNKYDMVMIMQLLVGLSGGRQSKQPQKKSANA
jgi:hypothetical protein